MTERPAMDEIPGLPARRAALFTALDRLQTQCFMTGTDPMLFDALGSRARTVLVSNGQLDPKAA